MEKSRKMGMAFIDTKPCFGSYTCIVHPYSPEGVWERVHLGLYICFGSPGNSLKKNKPFLIHLSYQPGSVDSLKLLAGAGESSKELSHTHLSLYTEMSWWRAVIVLLSVFAFPSDVLCLLWR